MRKFVTLLLTTIVILPLAAQKVTLSPAGMVAENFYYSHAKDNLLKQAAVLSQCRTEGNDTLLFIFNIGETGFVIVPGDMSVSPVLAFSDEGNFKPNDISPALEDWLQYYAEETGKRINDPARSVHREWQFYMDDDAALSIKGQEKGVAPLISTNWDQGSGYNYKCPTHTAGPGGRCYAGCVATAMAMVLKYYNYPETGVGSNSYYHPFYGTISADFGATNYEWTAMTNTLNSASREAISTLIFHCGVSVNMYYTPLGSSSYTQLAVNAFKNNFHYRNTLQIESRNAYFDTDWRIKLRDHLDESKPIMYSGSGPQGGHAFVCDGYIDTTRFHFNWGWSGSGNGYFMVSDLSPGGTDFTSGQDAIFGIVPYFAPYCQSLRTFTDVWKEFGDGSLYSYYWDNSDCDWLIQPAGAEEIILLLSDFNTEEGKDIVNVYDGSSTSDPLLGSFSGNIQIPALTAYSGSMLVTFNTDGQNQGAGWHATYTATIPAGMDENQKESIAIYPTPAQDNLHIVLPNEINGSVSVDIVSITGQIVNSFTVAPIDREFLIDVSSLVQGVYFLVIKNEGNYHYKRFVK